MQPMESRSFEVLDSHKRMLERQAYREENQRKEHEASVARLEKRKRLTVEERVDNAARKMKNRNVPATIALLEGLPTRELDFYLLAEEIGLNRSTVLRQFPKVRASVRATFEGTPTITEDESPNETPETVGQTEE